jgi:type IV pilus assembly protein PilA
MIVVAIIGILAAVAIPAYQDYIDNANAGVLNSYYESAKDHAKATFAKDAMNNSMGITTAGQVSAVSWASAFNTKLGNPMVPGTSTVAFLAAATNGCNTTNQICVYSATPTTSVTIERPTAFGFAAIDITTVDSGDL